MSRSSIYIIGRDSKYLRKIAVFCLKTNIMAKSRQQKEEIFQGLVEQLKSSKSAVFANFQGLTVAETEELRNECRASDIKLVVSKKTILKKALSESGIDVDTKSFEGGVVVALGLNDEVAPAQVLAKFAKSHNIVTLFGGILEGSFIDSAKVTQLSELPSKQQLLGQLVGTINAPVSGFVNVLAGNLRGLVGVLNNIKEAKAE